MIERIPIKEQPKVIDTLEIAAGDFSLVQEMKRVADEQKKLLDFGANVVISDYHSDLLADTRDDLRAGRSSQEKTLDNEIRVAIDNASMPFPDGSVKRIISANFFSSESAMHTEYRDGGNSLAIVKRYINEIRRVLAPGGYLFIHDTLSPEVSDFIIEEGLFDVDFEEVNIESENGLGLDIALVDQLKNRYGEQGIRGVKVFKKK